MGVSLRDPSNSLPGATMQRPLAFAFCATLLFGPSAAAQTPAEWGKGATCYEIFVRSFHDSDGDGIGDLKGLTQKLDYINDGNPASTKSLGARCIWLMPVDASPSYHGYDVKNYYRINPDYGTNDDFKRLVAAAHKRGIKVLVDLVLNHASSEHPYFKEALRDTASAHRNWFRFSKTKPDQKGPWGQQVWHKSPVRDEYYYGVFTAEMPDLNYENPAVRREASNVAKFWLTTMGVDGFRLDAVPYLVEEGNKLDHTTATHAVLRQFAQDVRRFKPNAYTIGEVWDSIGTQLAYYPDQLDAYFTFEASDAILMAVRDGSAKHLLAPLLRMQSQLPAYRYSPFLRNHDQTRTMTALGNDMARAKLAAELLLTLPGLPYVYYGEEIGMTGDKPDPRLRTPMQWTPGAGAGFTRGLVWEPLQPDSATANVAVQDADKASLLNLYRRLIHLRSTNSALGAGTLIPLQASTDAVAAWVRRDGSRMVLVVANLGTTPLSNVAISSAVGGLSAGVFAMKELLGGAAGAEVTIERGGNLRDYVPLSTLAPMQTYIFQLTSR
ncbi:alpha-amylase family glycosyl hydrolase [soil metagenome]